jgi:hypothetical protein
MRALTRMRTLAAACALLLFVSGTAMAGLGNRFIDRPGTPEPPMVGDPDTGNEIVALFLGPWLITVRVPIRATTHDSQQVRRPNMIHSVTRVVR